MVWPYDFLHGHTPSHHQSHFKSFFNLYSQVWFPSGLVMWCVLYDLGCVLCCVYDLVWNLKTYLRNALNTGQVRLLTTAPIH